MLVITISTTTVFVLGVQGDGLTVFYKPLTFAATTTSGASFNLPVGTAPTSPVNGDVWREAETTAGFKIRINGVSQSFIGGRVAKRVTLLNNPGSSPTINTDNCDVVNITGQASNITSMTTNLSGTPVDGDMLRFSITGTASRSITWGDSFEASTVALPTTTVSTDRLDVGFLWNTATTKWRCVAVS